MQKEASCDMQEEAANPAMESIEMVVTGEGAPSTQTSNSGTTPKLSKNQIKRQQKWERAMANKKRRKDLEKAVKRTKAAKEGRNVEDEKRIMEENRKGGAGRAKREEKWKRHFEENSSKFRLCVDCSFEDKMMQSEIKSLASQLRFCYSYNKNSKHPVQATVTSLSGESLSILEKVAGFDQWYTRAFETTKKDLLEVYPDHSKLVYLTSDSNNTLEKLEDDKIYIIGGIVDRNRLKRAAIGRAEQLGIATAKLPITEHLSFTATKVLTVNHVFDIMLQLREHNSDWKKTLLDILPERKDVKESDNE